MLHGNPLLRGWRLSDVSFYTTELPEYMLVELVKGIRPDVVHVAGADLHPAGAAGCDAGAAARQAPHGPRAGPGGEGFPGIQNSQDSPVVPGGQGGQGPRTGQRPCRTRRVLIAAGIMPAPQLGNGVYVLLLAPDHRADGAGDADLAAAGPLPAPLVRAGGRGCC